MPVLKLLPENLNQEQIKRISEIFMGLGHIAVASIFLPALIDKFNIFLLLLGLAAAIGFWLTSIAIAGRIKHDRY